LLASEVDREGGVGLRLRPKSEDERGNSELFVINECLITIDDD